MDPLADGISHIELEAIHGSDLDICNSARVSYGKKIETFSDNDRKLISYLIKHKHTSPLEHNMIRFRVKCPIFVARQWMRHRIGVSYNEISYRYAKAKDEFHIPSIWRQQDLKNKQSSIEVSNLSSHSEDHQSLPLSFSPSQRDEHLSLRFKETVEKCVSLYEDMITMGICREQARTILPVSLYTEFVFTCNLNSLFHFLLLRMDKGAQLEIRQFANCMLDMVKNNFPVTIEEWKKFNKL